MSLADEVLGESPNEKTLQKMRVESLARQLLDYHEQTGLSIEHIAASTALGAAVSELNNGPLTHRLIGEVEEIVAAYRMVLLALYSGTKCPLPVDVAEYCTRYIEKPLTLPAADGRLMGLTLKPIDEEGENE